MKKIVSLVLMLALTACSTIEKVEGKQDLNGRMSIEVTDAWNKVPNGGAGPTQPFVMWTQEGLTLDHLRIWSAVRPGAGLVAQQVTPQTPNGTPTDAKAPRVPTYVAGMPMDQVVSLFETLYAMDGSRVAISKVEPAVFAGEKGVRFEFSIARKSDDVEMQGVGWAAVSKGELYAATFVAPRLSFFARLSSKAEAVVRTARIKA